LSDEERGELKALAQRPDAEIDFSDIPERLPSNRAKAGLPLEEHTVTLRLDSEVVAWLETAGESEARQINQVLRRMASRGSSASSDRRGLLEKAS
jgi:uncharacterized protein (DUF4415 family)